MCNLKRTEKEHQQSSKLELETTKQENADAKSITAAGANAGDAGPSPGAHIDHGACIGSAFLLPLERLH